MKRLGAVGAMLALFAAAGCSSSNSSPDGGASVDSGTGQDAGVDAGPSNVLGGDLAFAVTNSVPIWSKQPDGGALNPARGSLLMGTLSRDEMCAAAARFVTVEDSLPAGNSVLIELFGTSTLSPGSFGQGFGPGHAVLFLNQAGSASFSAVGPTDSVTLTSVTLPTDLGGGSGTGGELQGTFDTHLSLVDGGTSHFTGTFDAIGCSGTPFLRN